MRSFLGALLSIEFFRGAIAPVVHRLERCTGDDIAALEKFFGFFGGGPMTKGERKVSAAALGDSRPLFFQIAAAEFWRPPGVTLAAAKTELDSMVMALPVTRDVARVVPGWPKRVGPDAFHGVLPEFTRPLLMLQGALDPSTPAKYTEALRAKYKHPAQTFVLFPAGAHDLTSGTRTKTTGGSCALQLYVQFLADPNAPLDISCIADAEDVTFLSEDGASLALFGKSDPWD